MHDVTSEDTSAVGRYLGFARGRHRRVLSNKDWPTRTSRPLPPSSRLAEIPDGTVSAQNLLFMREGENSDGRAI